MAQNSDTAGPSYTFFHDCRKSSVTSYDPCANLNNLATGNRRTLLYQECFLSVIRSQDLLSPVCHPYKNASFNSPVSEVIGRLTISRPSPIMSGCRNAEFIFRRRGAMSGQPRTLSSRKDEARGAPGVADMSLQMPRGPSQWYNIEWCQRPVIKERV